MSLDRPWPHHCLNANDDDRANRPCVGAQFARPSRPRRHRFLHGPRPVRRQLDH